LLVRQLLFHFFEEHEIFIPLTTLLDTAVSFSLPENLLNSNYAIRRHEIIIRSFQRNSESEIRNGKSFIFCCLWNVHPVTRDIFCENGRIDNGQEGDMKREAFCNWNGIPSNHKSVRTIFGGKHKDLSQLPVHRTQECDV
jgi:hypothetical protein